MNLIKKFKNWYKEANRDIADDYMDILLDEYRKKEKELEERKKRKKIKRPDIDPYGEEFWGYENESKIFENLSLSFNVGDIIYVDGEVDSIYFNYKRGTVILTHPDLPLDYNDDYDYLILFDDKFDDELHDANETGLDLPRRCYYVYKDNVMSEEYYKEILEKREKQREKYKDIDPFGEEEWEE